MTKEEIMQGRELDALVGAQVMGLDIVEGRLLPHLPKYYLPEYERTIFTDVPLYSSDIAAAWEVVEKMRTTHKQYITIIDNPHLNYDVRFSGSKSSEYHRLSNLPLAISRAALLAVMEVNP